MRRLSAEEKTVLYRLSEKLSQAQRSQFLIDIDSCHVDVVTSDGSRRLFVIDGYSRPDYIGQHPYPVEGGIKDFDGADMTVCVYADQNDRLLELEIIRWQEGDIIAPQWDTFEVTY